jgi:hypothetical protein
MLREKIWEHEEILSLRQKFNELDPQTQSYVLIGSFSGFVLLLLITFVTLWTKTIALKSEVAQLEEQIKVALSSAVRIEELKAMERNRTADSLLRDFDATGPADAFAERVSAKALIAKTAAEITGKAGAAEMKLNKISLRQLTRVLYLLEKSGSGAVLDKLNVDTRDDPEGYLWAQLSFKKEIPKGGP